MKGPYSDIGVRAKPKKITTKNPVGSPAPAGDFPSPTINEKPGQLRGLGQPSKPFRRPHPPGAHGYGHVASMKKGNLRLSGYANAHRIGAGGVLKKPGRKAPDVG